MGKKKEETIKKSDIEKEIANIDKKLENLKNTFNALTQRKQAYVNLLKDDEKEDK